MLGNVGLCSGHCVLSWVMFANVGDMCQDREYRFFAGLERQQRPSEDSEE